MRNKLQGLKQHCSLKKEKLVCDFQQQCRTVRDISLGGEKAYRELQTTQEELKKAEPAVIELRQLQRLRAGTSRKKHYWRGNQVSQP